MNLGTRFFLRGEDCNNPSFWEIEINGFIKIPKFLETTKTFILNTRLISCLLKLVNLSICSHTSNKKSRRRVLKQIL
jgi:hypothetical protein